MNKANMSQRNTRRGRASMAAISALLAILGVATLSPQASSVIPMLRRQLSLEENYGVKRPDGMQMGWEQVREILHVTPPGHNILVFGLGNDSPLWHKSVLNAEGRDGRVVFLEDDFVDEKAGVQWFDEITAKYPYLEAYKVHYSTKVNGDFKKYMSMYDNNDHTALAADLDITSQLPADLLDVVWDTIIVDAPLGCCNMGPGRYQSLYTSKILADRQAANGHSTHIFVDDYERKVEREFSQKVFGGAPLGVISREKGVSNANEQAHFRVGPATENKENSSKEWVLLLTVSEGFHDMFQNFWSAFTKLNLANVRVSIVAEDPETLAYLSNKFADAADGPVVEIRRGTDLSGDNAINDHAAQYYNSHLYRRLVSRRANYIRNELQAAPMVIYSDIDSVWLKDPTAFLSEDDVDMWGQKDDNGPSGTYFCTGLIAFRQTKASLEFLEMWDEALLENPQLNQPIFNRLIGDHPDLLKTATLPFSKFPNGALYFAGAFKGEVMENKEDVYIVHNNYIQGHENKVDRFKAHGLWSEQ